ncbi:hypothetical protein HOD20_02910 [archaeon]|jgi:hypothetical protein|nr:hypothetical protein [archaeon]MBT4351455.1 hypothetical protein [archaeon]MBT4647743.1 hypothetical protein [archaeon]MBT6821271.1 hypothetical protein [archaeon]MBT7392052.1 hypothetical protein [archaeon]
MNTSISPLEDEIKTLEPKVLELFEESKRIAGLLNNEIPVESIDEVAATMAMGYMFAKSVLPEFNQNTGILGEIDDELFTFLYEKFNHVRDNGNKLSSYANAHKVSYDEDLMAATISLGVAIGVDVDDMAKFYNCIDNFAQEDPKNSYMRQRQKGEVLPNRIARYATAAALAIFTQEYVEKRNSRDWLKDRIKPDFFNTRDVEDFFGSKSELRERYIMALAVADYVGAGDGRQHTILGNLHDHFNTYFQKDTKNEKMQEIGGFSKTILANGAYIAHAYQPKLEQA